MSPPWPRCGWRRRLKPGGLGPSFSRAVGCPRIGGHPIQRDTRSLVVGMTSRIDAVRRRSRKARPTNISDIVRSHGRLTGTKTDPCSSRESTYTLLLLGAIAGGFGSRRASATCRSLSRAKFSTKSQAIGSRLRSSLLTTTAFTPLTMVGMHQGE